MKYLDSTGAEHLVEKIYSLFVKKESGKGLSTNDYTTTEKNKLSGIETGAEVNKIDSIKVNGTAQTITNKAVDITIPSAVTEATVSGWGFTKNTGTYSKPSTGIPKTDLASAVQTSLGKADTAIQSSDISNFITKDVNNLTYYTKTTDINNALALKQNITDDNLQTVNKTISSAINEVNSIAKGANQALSYGNYSTMITAFNALASDVYNVGQNVMIVTLEVPDLWISSIENTSIPYTYVDDETFTNALKTNGYVQVGYYRLSALETQKVDLTKYAKTEDIPTTLSELTADSTHRLVTDTEKTTWNSKGTYSKPSGGIPKTDLASAVQTSLGKADSALQEHQDISGKQDKLVSGTNIKTINNQSILGSGNINIQNGEALPVGSEIDYDGNTVPTGWQEIDDPSVYSTAEQKIGTWIDRKTFV